MFMYLFYTSSLRKLLKLTSDLEHKVHKLYWSVDVWGKRHYKDKCLCLPILFAVKSYNYHNKSMYSFIEIIT